MNQLSTELKVGIFTLISAIIIAYMFFVLSPDAFNNDVYYKYHTILSDASGIVTKSHVKTNGVSVGKVSKVSLQNNKTRIDFEVLKDVKIPVGSSVSIKEKGLLGDVFLEISRFEDKGEYIVEGGHVPPSDEQVSISALVGIGTSIGRDIKEVTSVLANVLGGPEGEKDFKDIVVNIKKLTEDSQKMIAENRQDIRKLISNLERTSNTLKKVIGDNENDLNSIVNNIKLATDDLKLFSKSMKEIVGSENRQKFEQIIAAFDNTMQDVEVTAKNVRLVADRIEKGEGTIGKLVNDDKVLTDLQATINDVRKVLAPATKLQLSVDYHGELRKDKSTQHYFNTFLRTRPDKFYILGFTDLNETVKETQLEELEPTEGSDSTVVNKKRERIVERKAIRFNIQFGKRWHFAQLRFGLFESRGGIASDFFLFNDKFKFTLEAFDWNHASSIRRTAHVKAYASILFFEHVYALVGIDDPTRLDLNTGKAAEDPNYFIGAGLNFDDQDLKAIFGTAALAL